MKKIILAIMAVCLVTGLALAANETAATTTTTTTTTTAPAVVADTLTLTGDIIDNMCAGGQKAENLAAFIKTHTKECALMDQCAASGYSIYTNGALMKFDMASSMKVAEFLKKPESKLQVVAVVKKEPLNELSLVSIENQK